jgi:hypothetical protein
MSLRSPTDNEKQTSVIPAWIAGIQIRKDASGDVHVGLDSSTPCWNDATEGVLPKTNGNPSTYIFKGVAKTPRF